MVEAHGTGTTLGDPIEAQALLATYGQGRRGGRPLWLGSVKSNIGHTQAAAGVAGRDQDGAGDAARAAAADAARRRAVAARRLVGGRGAAADRAGAVAAAASVPRRAGVSSFGISGTNAHVILEEPPLPEAEPPLAAEEPPLPATGSLAVGSLGAAGGELGVPALEGVPALGVVPWLVSGRSEVAVRAQAGRLRAYLQAHLELEPRDVAYSLATARAQHSRRAAVVAGDREGLLGGLAALAEGGSAGSVCEGRVAAGKTAFMFTGQGAQRPGMGAGLYEAFPGFRVAFDEVCVELDGRLGRSLREVVFAVEGSPEAVLLDGTEFTQAALFALEVALARQLQEWGVRPDLLIGHSIGEVVAAYLAGVFSLADACTLVAARGRLMGALPEGGAMLAVEASEEEVVQSLDGLASRVALAAVNGPRAVVLSGDEEAVEELGGVWRERGRRVKRLRVSHAFHSPRDGGDARGVRGGGGRACACAAADPGGLQPDR